MFDHYRPAGTPRCPWCGQHLEGWQGKDGPCGLYVYEEGEHAPVAQEVDDDLAVTESELARATLERSVVIYAYGCPHEPVKALAVVRDGRWCETVMLPARASRRDDWRLVEEGEALVALDPLAPVCFVEVAAVVPAAVWALNQLTQATGGEVVAVGTTGALPEVRRALAEAGLLARVVGAIETGEQDAWLARHPEVKRSVAIDSAQAIEVAAALLPRMRWR